jgi:hypothetical protein
MEGIIVYKVFEQEIAETYGITTSYKGIKLHATYDQLVKALGEPTFPLANYDETVQKSWVCRWNSSTYEIYDLNNFDEEYTMNFNKRWFINTDSQGDALEFANQVESLIHNKQLKPEENGIN